MSIPSKDRTNKLLEMMSSWNTKTGSASGSQTPNSSTLRKKKQGQRTLPGSSSAVVVKREASMSTSEFEDFEAVEYIKAQANQPKTPRKDDDRGRSKDREEPSISRRSKSSSASNSASNSVANSAANSRASSPRNNASSAMSETEAVIKRAQAIRGTGSPARADNDDRSETSSVSSASSGIPRPGGSRLPVFGGSNLPRPGVKRAQSSYALTAQPDAELLLSGPLPNASAAAAVVAASGNSPGSAMLTPISVTGTPSSVTSSRTGPSPAPALPRSLSASPAPQSLSVSTSYAPTPQAAYPSAASPSPIASPSAPSDGATAAALLRIRSSTPSLSFNASTGTYSFASASGGSTSTSVPGSLASSRSVSGASSPVHGGPAPIDRATSVDRRSSQPEILDSDIRSRGSSDADSRQFDELGPVPPAFPDAAQDAMLKQLSERLQNTTRALETQPLAELDHSQLMQELLNVSRMLHVRVTAEKLYSRLRRLEYQLQGQEAVHKMTIADMEAEHKSQIKVLTEQWSTKVRANTQKFQEEVHMREVDISQLQTEMHRLRELLKNNGIPF